MQSSSVRSALNDAGNVTGIYLLFRVSSARYMAVCLPTPFSPETHMTEGCAGSEPVMIAVNSRTALSALSNGIYVSSVSLTAKHGS